MTHTISKRQLAEFIVLLAFVVIFYFSDYNESVNRLIAIATLLLSSIWIYKCWNNIYLLIMSLFIFYSNYSVVVGIYLDSSLRPRYLYPQIDNVQIYGKGIAMLLILMLFLDIFTVKKGKVNVKADRNNFIKKDNHNSTLFFINWLLLHFIIVLGYSKNAGGRGSASAIFEYGSILLLIMFYFSGDRKEKRLFCIESVLFYALTSFINGTRIEALICILLFILCFFKNGISHALLVVGMVCGLLLFSIIGTIRGNWSALLSGSVSILDTIFHNKFVFDTCTHAYFPALCMIEMFNDYSVSVSAHYFLRFIATIIIGQSRVKDGDLIQVVASNYYHNQGGFTIGFFYVWFSYIGSLIYGIIVRHYIKLISNISDNTEDYKMGIFFYFIASVPRWYLYGPWSMFRGVLVCFLIFEFFKILAYGISGHGKLSIKRKGKLHN